MLDDLIAELEEQLAQLKKQWPAHSVPAAMLEQLDELEEKIAEAKRLLAQVDSQTKSNH
jgi:paraquat-inducible protein B